MDKSDLSLKFIAGNQVETSLKWIYQGIYQHWHSIWSQTFQEIQQTQPFFSDNFIRQDEIMGIFYQGKCIAACCHRFADMSLSTFKSDSYFEVWSEEAIARLRKNGDLIIIDSQITVDPNFRKTNTDIRIAELITFISLHHLISLPISSITAASRNLRSMNEIFEKFGAQILAENVISHGEETNLYAFYPGETSFAGTSQAIIELGDKLLQESQRSKLINPIFRLGNRRNYVKKAA